jgi:hypothetical protein
MCSTPRARRGVGLPDVAALVQPLEGVLAAARTLTSSGTLQLLAH